MSTVSTVSTGSTGSTGSTVSTVLTVSTVSTVSTGSTGATGAKKIQKLENGHETDKYPTKSDENWSIWSQTGQGNLFRGVPDPKKIQKRSKSSLIWAKAHFGRENIWKGKKFTVNGQKFR